VVEASLDLLQKLVAHNLLTGSADALPVAAGEAAAADADDPDGGAGEASPSGGSTGALPPSHVPRRALHAVPVCTDQAPARAVCGAAVELMCRGYELGDDAVELQLLRGLLTAISCASFRVHGEALLRCVRTCYNVFLGSKSEVNQTAAKATLTQALTIVFHRMEQDSALVPPPAITVADLLFPGSAEAATSPVTQFVQGFVTRVLSDLPSWSAAAAVVSAATSGGAESVLLSERDGAFHTDGEEDDGLGHTAPGHQHSSGASGSGAPGAQGQQPSVHQAAPEPRAGDDGDDAPDEATSSAHPGGAAGHEEERVNAASAALRRDAFLVFRALCKLSMKAAPEGSSASSVADAFAHRSKLLSLELLKILLANAGPVFRSSPKFARTIRQFLCRSLLKNCSSGALDLFNLSCSIYIRLLERFRPHLKAEIGIFTEVIFLKALQLTQTPGKDSSAASAALTPVADASPVPYGQRVTVLRCLGHQCRDAQLMVDLFVNYDCDLNNTNLFERVTATLLGVVREGCPADVASGLILPTQEAAMRVAATRALTDMTLALAKWIDKDAAAQASARAAATAAAEAAVAAQEAMAEDTLAAATAERQRQGDSTAGALTEAERFEQAKTNKVLFREGIALFYAKPKKGIQFLQKAGLLSEQPAEVAHFLATTPDLDKTQIGELLGSPDEGDLRVMHAYVDAMDFPGFELDEAIRAFLAGFRLPGEAQKIDRLMEKFAERFCRVNPGAFKSADTAYVLSYSVIMLNTDAHNPMVKTKMSKQEFLRNNRGIDDGSDVPEEYLGNLYDRITSNEIKMKDPALDAQAKAAAAAKSGVADELSRLFLNLIPGRKAATQAVDPADVIMESVRTRALSSSEFVSAEDSNNVKPMWAALWEPLLRIVTAAFDAAEDKATVMQCLDFLRCGVHLGASLGLEAPRDAFVQALAKHTQLTAPASMRAKHVEALRALVAAAEHDANNLGAAWVHVLRCISRYEHLHNLGSGFNDASLFTPDMAAAADAATSGARAVKPSTGAFGALRLARSSSSVGSGAAATAPPPSGSSAAAAAKKRGSGGTDGLGEGDEEVGPPPPKWVLDALSPEELAQRVFLRTHVLDSDAIVAFVQCLCIVSLEELRAARSPRVYSLARIVEVAHFNMGRIRLVWSRIWAVLADFFVTVGLLRNLSCAMYVVDSLRQLSMQFLSRDELAQFSFQNDFFRPYVVIMRHSPEPAIRELIIRCMAQMVAARVHNIRSGWKSLFMVFTAAAADTQRSIVVLAFETMERIMRQHFNHICEADSAAFTDCVNCLVAFTNSNSSPEVSLNAIAFLRFCALKLAEGALGNLEAAAAAQQQQSERMSQGGGALVSARTSSGAAALAAASAPGPSFFTDTDAHLYFWFPLLAGLSELTFDRRRDVRHSALEVLFDTLKFHGSAFSSRFWARVFDKILFPIFDHVRAEGLADASDDATRADPATPTSPGRAAGEEHVDAWLFETCTHCLHLIVDVFAQFFAQVAPLLPRLLTLLTSLSLRQHDQLAACGVAAICRLATSAGPLFSAEQWQQLLDAVDLTLVASQPNVERLAHSSDTGAAWLAQAAEVKGLVATQLLLVAAAEQLATAHAGELSGLQLRQLLDALQRAHSNAARVNADGVLRPQLRTAAATASQAAGPETPASARLAAALPDPPLLALEVQAGRAHLRALAAVCGATAQASLCRLDPSAGEERLAGCVADVLNATADGDALGDADEWAARAPLALDALDVLATAFNEAAFLRQHKLLFPACMQLVKAHGVPASVRGALGSALLVRLGPLLDRAASGTSSHTQ
jgi:brefeldin A-inhibited guanine nucleotide-exchange protein